MPSRAYTSFLPGRVDIYIDFYDKYVSMPSRAYTSFLLNKSSLSSSTLIHCFNALSGLYLISTAVAAVLFDENGKVFQCPLGLIPHFYEREATEEDYSAVSFNALSGLYLISTWSKERSSASVIKCFNALSGLYLISTKGCDPNVGDLINCFNALSGLYLISTRLSELDLDKINQVFQCPLGLIPHFYAEEWSDVLAREYKFVSMPSRAYTSFLPD